MIEKLNEIEDVIPLTERNYILSAVKISSRLNFPEEMEEFLKILSSEVNPIRKIKKYVERKYKVKLEDRLLGGLSKILEEIKKEEKIKLNISSKIDWEAGEFSDYDSCYWGSRVMAKKVLLENGGKAVKIFTEKGKSRCWLYPISRDSFVIFNIYSSEHLSLEDIAKIIVKYLADIGISAGFRKISFGIKRDETRLLYINGDVGILISSKKEDLENYKIYINPSYYCDRCGDPISWDQYSFSEEEILCESCSEIFSTCDCCGYNFREDDLTEVFGDYYCDSCFDELFAFCDRCGNISRKDETYYVENEGIYCLSCLENYTTTCDFCEKIYLTSDTVYLQDYSTILCKDCAEKNNVKYCDSCLESFYEEDLISIGKNYYCVRCAEHVYIICDNCGNQISAIESLEKEKKYICSSCFNKGEEK